MDDGMPAANTGIVNDLTNHLPNHRMMTVGARPSSGSVNIKIRKRRRAALGSETMRRISKDAKPSPGKTRIREVSAHGSDTESLKQSFAHHLAYSLAKDEFTSTPRDCYTSIAMTVRDRLVGKWIETQQTYYRKDAKRVYYLSLEFLIGRTLGNSLVNLDLKGSARDAVAELGYKLEDLQEIESDAGLGNGGLGRLAACFLDSMATLELPAYGYGIRYEYGIFFQRIINGYQVETPDAWLRYGNPWEIERPEFLYPVKFYGQVLEYVDEQGVSRHEWTDTRDIIALAFDTPIPGYRNNTVNTMRLWSAKSSREFDLEYFNHGDYEKAVSDKARSETISKVLYPNDNVFIGKELRLRQEYFFVSATIQDVMRRYAKTHAPGHKFRDFADKVAIQLNDTHPAIGIPELMRILLDGEGLGWEEAWDIAVRTFAYTNHTVLPEALEKWPVSLFQRVLPRHIRIIYEINRRFLEEVGLRFPGDATRQKEMSIIEEGPEKRINMAHLAIVGSHSVNGVSALHSDILAKEIFRYFNEMWPGKFNNKTNGITQRRWLKLCNEPLSELIVSAIGERWVTDLHELKKLIPLADDPSFRLQWRTARQKNKERLARYILDHQRIAVNPESLFDGHVKRIHEYKRQLLNALHVVSLYNNPEADMVPRTVLFAGKAAPGYFMAKLIIKLIASIADVINSDPALEGRLKVVFIENYSVSMAEIIVPAVDLSEQISTAGTEASGTGNMKFALNGAVTIGTLDGANIEIMEEVGGDNIFICGHTAEEIRDLRGGYDPLEYYAADSELKAVIDMISSGFFSRFEPELFRPLIDSLLRQGEPYLVLADFASYAECQRKVSRAYRDRDRWTRMSIMNVANMGYFSIDRTTRAYAEEIWNVKPVPISF
jgi:starch phosphorylase